MKNIAQNIQNLIDKKSNGFSEEMFSVYEVRMDIAFEIEQKDDIGLDYSQKMLDLQ